MGEYGSVSAQDGNFATGEIGGMMWNEKERRLRWRGRVDWRPFNGQIGVEQGKRGDRLREGGSLHRETVRRTGRCLA